MIQAYTLRDSITKKCVPAALIVEYIALKELKFGLGSNESGEQR